MNLQSDAWAGEDKDEADVEKLLRSALKDVTAKS